MPNNALLQEWVIQIVYPLFDSETIGLFQGSGDERCKHHIAAMVWGRGPAGMTNNALSLFLYKSCVLTAKVSICEGGC